MQFVRPSARPSVCCFNEPHTLVPGTASYPGPKYCFIPWSQILPHFLIPNTASFSGPRWTLCRVPGGPYVGSKNLKFQNGPKWAPINFRVHMEPFRVHMDAEGRPNGGLGAKPPEKGPFGPLGPYWWARLRLTSPPQHKYH